jgi:hypothetical protein
LQKPPKYPFVSPFLFVSSWPSVNPGYRCHTAAREINAFQLHNVPLAYLLPVLVVEALVPSKPQ